METLQEEDNKAIILLAYDTDFVPIIQKIREKTEVILYYYSNFDRKSKFFMSNILFTVCDRNILLTEEDLRKCQLERKNKP